MKTTELSLLAIFAGHLGFFSVPMLAMGAWFWGGVAAFVALLLVLRFVRVAMDEWQEEVDAMSAGTVWHPKSQGGPRPAARDAEEIDFEQEVEQVLHARRVGGGL